MRRIFTYLFLSLFIMAGTGEAFADRHDGHSRGGREKKEKVSDMRRDKDRGKGKHNHGKGNSKGRPGDMHMGHGPKYHAPAPKRMHNAPRHMGVRHMPPPPPPRHYGPVPPPPPRLAHMVRHATRGCHDVRVWQIDADTYIVKYRRGHRWYTQRIYPYDEIYGSPGTISVNWMPESPWNLIPSVHLNINL